ncbi:uncharacterized protein SCHCODRAFT_02563921 [Schizophyllum commune H4-8]|uniref:uncharacterized protein n=1 Tax=Schizophyllum commune (strain H4-8 / FGSC 9210) TaxID=578458 RepID=UPI00215E3889|nr:uncharacterized protein SCHCODRAFT_02563921 [Schizophyllum commune H4-8]KAI5897378.1 hypothetical protein SCHCODRAFT_02563921 [Schizophyllum commune H4-8]
MSTTVSARIIAHVPIGQEHKGVSSDIVAPRLLHTMAQRANAEFLGFVDRSSISKLSPEILQLVFDRAVPPCSLISPGYAVREDARVFAMKMKTTLPLVCRAWYGPSIEYFYGNITLRTVGQAAALHQTLERTPSLAALVRELTFACYVSPFHEAAYAHAARAIMRACCSLRRASFVQHCDGNFGVLLPILQQEGPEPRSDVQICLDLYSGEEVDVPEGEPWLVEEYWKTAPLYAPLRPGTRTVADLAPSLVELNLTLHPAMAELLVSEVVFCALATFTCVDYMGYGKDDAFDAVIRHWRMPVLRNLTIRLDAHRSMERISAFVRANGSELRYLHFQTHRDADESGRSWSLEDVLGGCPRLVHLVVPWHVQVPRAHPSLRWVDVWAAGRRCPNYMLDENGIRKPGIWEAFAPTFAAPEGSREWEEVRAAFPNFRGMRTLGKWLEVGSLPRDLARILKPEAWTGASAAFEYPGMHVRHDAEGVWWADSVEYSDDYGDTDDELEGEDGESWSQCASEESEECQEELEEGSGRGKHDCDEGGVGDDEDGLANKNEEEEFMDSIFYYPSDSEHSEEGGDEGATRDEDDGQVVEEDSASSVHSSDSEWEASDDEEEDGENRQWSHEDVLRAFRRGQL